MLQGLSPQQLAQLLTNCCTCLAQVFDNHRDYQCIPPAINPHYMVFNHLWGTCPCCTLHHATRRNCTLETHCCSTPGHDLHLTLGFLHHMGLFLHIFDDWLNVSDQDMEYQAFIAYDSTNIWLAFQIWPHLCSLQHRLCLKLYFLYRKWTLQRCSVHNPYIAQDTLQWSICLWDTDICCLQTTDGANQTQMATPVNINSTWHKMSCPHRDSGVI